MTYLAIGFDSCGNYSWSPTESNDPQQVANELNIHEGVILLIGVDTENRPEVVKYWRQ